MITTRFGSEVKITDCFSPFGDFERVMVEFKATGFETFMNVEDLAETEKGEIRRRIDELKDE